MDAVDTKGERAEKLDEHLRRVEKDFCSLRGKDRVFKVEGKPELERAVALYAL